MRKCLNCSEQLVRRDNEKRAEFLGRKYCNQKCSVADRPRVNAEKRAALDLKDQMEPSSTSGLTFTTEEILRRAHMAAPQIPVTILADVIRDVLPMVEANTRHRILAPIAAEMRVKRLAS